MNHDRFDAQWRIISGRIHRLRAEQLGDYAEAIKGNLQEISGILQKKFGLAKEEAANAVKRWRNDHQPAALLKGQWKCFQDAMQDKWHLWTPHWMQAVNRGVLARSRMLSSVRPR